MQQRRSANASTNGGGAAGANGVVGGGGGGIGESGSGCGAGSVGASGASGSGGIGNGGVGHTRSRVQPSTLPSDNRPPPRNKARGITVKATAPGWTPDNRAEVMGRVRAHERKRRLEGRVTCNSESIPEIRVLSGAEVGRFGDFARRKVDGPDGGWGAPRGGWPVMGGKLCDGEGDGTPTASLTGAVSSAARSDAGWGVISSSLSASSEEGGEDGNSWDGSGCSATASASGSATGDSLEHAPWSEELASSLGIVTNVVLPSHSAETGFVPRGSGRGVAWGWEAATWGGDDDEEDDEEEREMSAALEVCLGVVVVIFVVMIVVLCGIFFSYLVLIF